MSSLLNKAKDAMGKSGGSGSSSGGAGQQSGAEKAVSGQAHTRMSLRMDLPPTALMRRLPGCYPSSFRRCDY